MRKNCSTKILGRNIILVPYRKMHVFKYNQWMQSKELQELTASEPLTEEEEYEMQQSWLNDENKCTFIVLDKSAYEDTRNESEAMIGDTNLYLAEEDGVLTAETGIMIAETSVRGKGRGREAMLLMLRYGARELNIKKYLAKISLSNKISVNMFKALNFTVESESEVFQEVTLCAEVTPDWLMWLEEQTQHMTTVTETEDNV